MSNDGLDFTKISNKGVDNVNKAEDYVFNADYARERQTTIV